MKSVNRWLYGPTPEEKVRSWQTKLRQQERQLDKEIRNVRPPMRSARILPLSAVIVYLTDINWITARDCYPEIKNRAEATGEKERREISKDLGKRGRQSEQTEG